MLGEDKSIFIGGTLVLVETHVFFYMCGTDNPTACRWVESEMSEMTPRKVKVSSVV